MGVIAQSRISSTRLNRRNVQYKQKRIYMLIPNDYKEVSLEAKWCSIDKYLYGEDIQKLYITKELRYREKVLEIKIIFQDSNIDINL